ncbi:ATP-binding protein [Pseudoalteromonas sp. A757]|uniref:ATP-binding protein n=1 Tax=Pseudoalteromonas sp. A757 TaxID=2250709 RepID=UPI000FFF5438|nr:ATP-binding protein [Pseudoalteromonas sp. A757]RXE85947.1 ATP-binding protein [Pseudoalteromonas sp. A757]
MEASSELSNTLGTSFGERFISDYLGHKMSSDPLVAIVELIANAWDAGAKNVSIEWPSKNINVFSITDDGHGMTMEQFSLRWTQLSYNRQEGQGSSVEIPKDNNIHNVRKAYGRNGKGRFSALCFGDKEYFIETKRDDEHNCFKVRMSSGMQPFKYEAVSLPAPSRITAQHGTSVFVNNPGHIGITESKVRSEIGLRFLTDPDFIVKVNGKQIKFNDIDRQKVKELFFEFNGSMVLIKAIQTEKSDKTTHQHGVAWHANNRLIGECGWSGLRNDHILDGRTSLAKQYTFIVDASLISDEIEADWTAFKRTDKALSFYDLAKETIANYLLNLSLGQRKVTTNRLREENRYVLNQAGLLGVSRWSTFVDTVQVECPKIKEPELEALASILAKLEASTFQYSLIHKLNDFTSNDFDDLHEVLADWNISSAKAVLDEIKARLTLIESIREKVKDPATLEVQELQPLFEKALWVFGPEFESIEFTSNEGMTKVIKKLFKIDDNGSRNRPDFVVLPDSSIGLYGRYDYDDSGYEIGLKKVVIVELKKPSVPLGEEEKNQCWKYAKELYAKGAILSNAKIDCYLLGDSIQPQESGIDTKRDGDVRIVPLVFDTVLKRAETRLLNLHKHVKEVPFLDQNEIQSFLDKNTVQLNHQASLL